MLAPLAGVESVRQTAPRQLMVTVADAATLTPRIMDTLRASGVGVAGIEEHVPTFDEVFTALVEQRRTARGELDEDPNQPRSVRADA